MSKYNYPSAFTRCVCGATTTKKYAKAHGGKCKACVTGTPSKPKGWLEDQDERRNATIIDCGYQAYAREEGHYG